MKTINVNDFKNNTEQCLLNAVINDDFLTVETHKGKAVIISEAEYTMLIDALKMCIVQDKKLSELSK